MNYLYYGAFEEPLELFVSVCHDFSLGRWQVIYPILCEILSDGLLVVYVYVDIHNVFHIKWIMGHSICVYMIHIAGRLPFIHIYDVSRICGLQVIPPIYIRYIFTE